AVEAGERLGFLPGDLRDKVDPYLRPLYDALYDMMPADQVMKRLSSGEIEIAPLAFMRGRTLANSFVILDEAQNTTPVQMKMFLTRLGENARMAVTGDLSQIALPDAKPRRAASRSPCGAWRRGGVKPCREPVCWAAARPTPPSPRRRLGFPPAGRSSSPWCWPTTPPCGGSTAPIAASTSRRMCYHSLTPGTGHRCRRRRRCCWATSWSPARRWRPKRPARARRWPTISSI